MESEIQRLDIIRFCYLNHHNFSLNQKWIDCPRLAWTIDSFMVKPAVVTASSVNVDIVSRFFLPTLIVLNYIEMIRSIFKLTVLIFFFLNNVYSQEINLFDDLGNPVAYIDLNDENKTIYRWDGTPSAYLVPNGSYFHIYGFNGNHLGWFENGIMRDHSGRVFGFQEGSVDMVLSLTTIKSPKKVKPQMYSRQDAPYKKGNINEFSRDNLNLQLYKGEISTYNSNNNYGNNSDGNIYAIENIGGVPDLSKAITPTLEIPVMKFDAINEALDEEVLRREKEVTRLENEFKQFEYNIENAKSSEERDRIIKEYKQWSNTNFPPETNQKAKEVEPNVTKFEINGTEITIYNPKVDSYLDESIKLTKIELKNNETILHFEFYNNGSGWVCINKAAHIINSDNDTKSSVKNMNKYCTFIEDAKGITFAPEKKILYDRYEKVKFTLIFPKIDLRETKRINFDEGLEDGGWKIIGIHLTAY